MVLSVSRDVYKCPLGAIYLCIRLCSLQVTGPWMMKVIKQKGEALKVQDEKAKSSPGTVRRRKSDNPGGSGDPAPSPHTHWDPS